MWRHLADLPGDRVPLALDQLVGEPQTVQLPPLPEAYWTGDARPVPGTVTPELAELVGYFMGDGSLHAGLRLCVADGDFDVVDRLVQLGKECSGSSPRRRRRATPRSRSTRCASRCGGRRAVRQARAREGHTGKGYGRTSPTRCSTPTTATCTPRSSGACSRPTAPSRPGSRTWTTARSLAGQSSRCCWRSVTRRRGSTTSVGAARELDVAAPAQHLVPHALARRDRLHGRSQGGEGAVQRGSPGGAAGPHPGDPRAGRPARAGERPSAQGAARGGARGRVSRRAASELFERTGDAELGHLLASSTTRSRPRSSATRSSPTTCRCRRTSRTSRTAS